MERKADRRKRTPRKSGKGKKPSNNGAKADFYLNVKVYQRDARGGFFELKGKPLERGMKELEEFVSEKFDVPPHKDFENSYEPEAYKPDYDPVALTRELEKRFKYRPF